MQLIFLGDLMLVRTSKCSYSCSSLLKAFHKHVKATKKKDILCDTVGVYTRNSPINQNTAAMKRMDVNIRAVDLQLLIFFPFIKVQNASSRKKLKTRKPICKFHEVNIMTSYDS